jgi:outer membrane receptor for Fe3+-dicitrate
MKKALLLLLFFTQTSFAFAKNETAQTSVIGLLTDNINQQPIEDAIVTIAALNKVEKTDFNGNFSFSKLPIGKYTLTIEKENFFSKNLIINILENKTIELNIELSVASFELETVTVKTDRGISASSTQLMNSLDFELRARNSAQDMLRNVPGLFTAQHAGGGKAEQIFLRGFDIDHGTDVAAFVDGIPVNMPSHGHGQGYLDLHFLIPETVQSANLMKGPYYAQFGDFSTAGAADFKTYDKLEKNTFQTEFVSTPTTARPLMSNRNLLLYELPLHNPKTNNYVAADYTYSHGYFDAKSDFSRYNILSKTTANLKNNNKLSFVLSNFNSSWKASGQVPERAVVTQIISRFGSIDPSEGGKTSRQNIALTHQKSWNNQQVETQFFASNYDFQLFSNFTFYLNDAQNGDEIEQIDRRKLIGFTSKYALEKGNNYITLGAGSRSDFITNQLWHTIDRTRTHAAANATIKQHNLNIFIKDEIKITDKLKAEIGLRANQILFDVTDNIISNTNHENYTGKNYQLALSPKINLSYSLSDNYKIFFNTGRGFHSNDARSVVQEKGNHKLPIATGGEIGFLLRPHQKSLFNIAFWGLALENELVFIGDEGTTENNGASHRYGVDISGRFNINTHLIADIDINLSRSLLVEKPLGKILKTDYYIPLAPRFTSTGGIAYRKKAVEMSLRYRHLAARPANEDASIMARAYSILDLNAAYTFHNNRFAISVENLLNQQWNEAQFATESRLILETAPVSEIHFTPGTPIALKLIYARNF